MSISLEVLRNLASGKVAVSEVIATSVATAKQARPKDPVGTFYADKLRIAGVVMTAVATDAASQFSDLPYSVYAMSRLPLASRTIVRRGNGAGRPQKTMTALLQRDSAALEYALEDYGRNECSYADLQSAYGAFHARNTKRIHHADKVFCGWIRLDRELVKKEVAPAVSVKPNRRAYHTQETVSLIGQGTQKPKLDRVEYYSIGARADWQPTEGFSIPKGSPGRSFAGVRIRKLASDCCHVRETMPIDNRPTARTDVGLRRLPYFADKVKLSPDFIIGKVASGELEPEVAFAMLG